MGSVVTLIGLASSDSDGTIASYVWSQTAGPAVTLTPTMPSGANVSFTAPSVLADTVLTFRLVVTDNLGATSAPDFENVTVRPLTAGQAPISGRITFARIPTFRTANGLNFAGTTQQPARGITVEIVNAGTNSIVSSGTTDSDGFYFLIATPNTTAFVRARAELVKSGALPNWNIRVQADATISSTQQTARGTDFNSGSGSMQNLAIQSGWDTVAGTYNSPRDAAPFAILDTVYRAITKLVVLNPSINLPNLIVDWAPENVGNQTFFSVSSAGPKIVLAGEANVDTDEYDAQVIAHEFGHFIEWRFGRSDSIGGPHTLGDRLDPRLAWGEGFGYWFAGVVNDDTLMIDTFGPQQSQSGGFDIETVFRNPGWFSESSVWTILWDLYDPANDDVASVGLAPIWAILTGPLRDSSAMTTIFTFITALKQANPGLVSQIDSVVGSQSIVAATIDDFGSTETNNAGVPSTLPVYASIGQGGGPLIVPSTRDFGTGNKLGNRHFVKMIVASPRTVRITANAAVAGQDPDVQIFKAGLQVISLSCTPTPTPPQVCGESGGNEDFNATLSGGTYVLEVYECNNAGCAGDTPTPADTTITVTVQ